MGIEAEEDINNNAEASDNKAKMGIEPITIEEVKEPLNPQERQEVDRDDFRIPLEFYLEGMNTNPQTSEEAREGALLKVRQAAIKRVAVRNEITKNPDIMKTPADNPLVIVGFHRSGTTMLHRLLESDKQFVTPTVWEMMEPLPPGRVEDFRSSARYLKAKAEFDKSIYDLSPEAQAKHVYDLELTDECMSILQDYFLELPEAHHNKAMGKWEDFVYNAPKEHVSAAYSYYKNVLQCLFYKSMSANQRILVKSGMHPLFLDTHQKIFPNARYVLIYRNPCEIVPSLSSLASEFGKRQGFFDDGLGKRICNYYGIVTRRGVEFLRNTPKDKVVVLGYRDMVKDPLAAVKKIYSNFDLTMTPEVEDTLKQHMTENKQHKHGGHKYSLADFGLTEEDIKRDMKEFIEYFKDTNEPMTEVKLK